MPDNNANLLLAKLQQQQQQPEEGAHDAGKLLDEAVADAAKREQLLMQMLASMSGGGIMANLIGAIKSPWYAGLTPGSPNSLTRPSAPGELPGGGGGRSTSDSVTPQGGYGGGGGRGGRGGGGGGDFGGGGASGDYQQGPPIARARTPYHDTRTWAGLGSGGRGKTPYHSSHPGISSGHYPGESSGTSDNVTPKGGHGGGNREQMMSYAMDQLRKEGVPEANLRAAAAHLTGQAVMESNITPTTSHDAGTGYGIYGAGKERRTAMLNWMNQHGYPKESLEGQARYMAHEAMSGNYPKTANILRHADPKTFGRDVPIITREFEAPRVVNQRTGAVENAFRSRGTIEDRERPPRTAGGGIAPGAVTAVGGGPPQAFIFHHTGGRGTVAGVQDTLRQRHLGVQYIMDREGNITKSGGPGAANIRPGTGMGAGLSNQNIVGMEIIARDDKDVTPAQVAAAKKFIQENYPNTPIFGHGQVNPGHKEATEGMTVTKAIQAQRAAGGSRADNSESYGPSSGKGGGFGRGGGGQSGGTYPGGGGVSEEQRSATTRRGAITGTLRGQLEYAAERTGLTFHVFSGGQRMEGAPGATGSHRHDQGNAADGYLTDKNGRKLDANNPEDKRQISEFIKHSVAAGATGIGAGPGYMEGHGGTSVHIGGGTSGTWGEGGAGKNAPGWVTEAWQSGQSSGARQEYQNRGQQKRQESTPSGDAPKTGPGKTGRAPAEGPGVSGPYGGGGETSVEKKGGGQTSVERQKQVAPSETVLRTNSSLGQGTAFHVGDGYYFSDSHNFDRNAKQTDLVFNGKTVKADIIHNAPDTDFAILRTSKESTAGLQKGGMGTLPISTATPEVKDALTAHGLPGRTGKYSTVEGRYVGMSDPVILGRHDRPTPIGREFDITTGNTRDKTWTQGMSGGPVTDAQGRAVGTMTGLQANNDVTSMPLSRALGGVREGTLPESILGQTKQKGVSPTGYTTEDAVKDLHKQNEEFKKNIEKKIEEQKKAEPEVKKKQIEEQKKAEPEVKKKKQDEQPIKGKSSTGIGKLAAPHRPGGGHAVRHHHPGAGGGHAAPARHHEAHVASGDGGTLVFLHGIHDRYAGSDKGRNAKKDEIEKSVRAYATAHGYKDVKFISGKLSQEQQQDELSNMIKNDKSVSGVFGFSRGGYSAYRALNALPEEHRGRIKQAVILGAPGTGDVNGVPTVNRGHMKGTGHMDMVQNWTRNQGTESGKPKPGGGGPEVASGVGGERIRTSAGKTVTTTPADEFLASRFVGTVGDPYGGGRKEGYRGAADTKLNYNIRSMSPETRFALSRAIEGYEKEIGHKFHFTSGYRSPLGRGSSLASGKGSYHGGHGKGTGFGEAVDVGGAGKISAEAQGFLQYLKKHPEMGLAPKGLHFRDTGHTEFAGSRGGKWGGWSPKQKAQFNKDFHEWMGKKTADTPQPTEHPVTGEKKDQSRLTPEPTKVDPTSYQRRNRQIQDSAARHGALHQPPPPPTDTQNKNPTARNTGHTQHQPHEKRNTNITPDWTHHHRQPSAGASSRVVNAFKKSSDLRHDSFSTAGDSNA